MPAWHLMRTPEPLFYFFKHCPPAKVLQVTIYLIHFLQKVVLHIPFLNRHFLQLPCNPAEPNTGLFSILSEVLRKADPMGTPLPFVLPAVTDGRYFTRLGIQTYGFAPMVLPRDFVFAETIHAANERIPVEAMEFGTNANVHDLFSGIRGRCVVAIRWMVFFGDYDFRVMDAFILRNPR